MSKGSASSVDELMGWMRISQFKRTISVESVSMYFPGQHRLRCLGYSLQMYLDKCVYCEIKVGLPMKLTNIPSCHNTRFSIFAYTYHDTFKYHKVKLRICTKGLYYSDNTGENGEEG